MFEPADIYLDYAAATPKRAEVAALHEQRCARFFANPHGTGRHSTDCRHAGEKAAAEILELLDIPADEADLYWTSGGTEAANLAILGGMPGQRHKFAAVTATAHACLLEPAQRWGADKSMRLPVREDGQIDLEKCTSADRGQTGMVGVCHVNNETGVRHDLGDIRRWMDATCPAAVLLVDALQSAGRMPVPWRDARIDMLTIGGRKLGGPAGLGALIVRRGLTVAPLLFGGGQQGAVRPGTVDVVGALELAHAVRLAVLRRGEELRHAKDLNSRLRAGLAGLAHGPCRIVSPSNASPWILCTAFEGYEGAILTRLLGGRGIAVSAGSACSADADETSHVLRAMGIADEEARGMLRISTGHDTTRAEIDHFIEELARVLEEY